MCAIKIKNCNITKPHAIVFQASLFPHKLSLLAQLVFFCKVIFIIPKLGLLSSLLFFNSLIFENHTYKWSHCLGLLSSLLFFNSLIFENHTYKWSFECPTSFSHLQLTTPIWLPFTDIYSHLLAQPQQLNFLPWFTTRVTNMVNLSLSKLSEHSLHGVEACRNDCLQA